MQKKIILIGALMFTISLAMNPIYAQFTDYNEHDPGIGMVEIPSWIKNTAQWWATDAITETEFLRAIEYLLDNKIIQIAAAPAKDIPDITATYTLPAGRQAEFAQVSGSFDIKHTGPLTLTIVQPDKSEQILTTISRDGTFTATMEITSNSQIGAYIVYAEIEGELHLVNAFEIKDKDANKVPAWIKNNARWWSEDKITDSDFVKGIEFLVSNKIITVDVTSKQTIPSGPGLIKDKCSGNARCFSGQVTQVIDGDTIRINEHSIRFALSSAPELGETGGEEAQDFIDDICPVGSEALIDEDDKQTEGSHGRIVAVIYCNERNLNAELLDANLGYLPTEFCSKSEFSSEIWAQKHGCVDSEPNLRIEGTESEDCDPSYPDFCIPSPPPDLDCKDIPQKKFTVLQPDPHKFDGNYDGVGCES
ncbi:MAG: thermonuclease family protein [Nitrosopumilaceae archaeon]